MRPGKSAQYEYGLEYGTSRYAATGGYDSPEQDVLLLILGRARPDLFSSGSLVEGL